MNTETNAWKIERVLARPTSVLYFWQVLEIKSPDGDVFRHFFGYPGRSTEFEISDPIVSFDPDRACGVTAQGMVYMIPHGSSNAATDITAEIVKQLLVVRWESNET
jgi:hypothetical protein